MKMHQLKKLVESIISEINVESFPINEYKDPETRKKAIESRPDDALKLIYGWVQQRTIDYREFVTLLGSVESQRKGYITDLEPRWNKTSGLRGQP